MNKKLGFNMIKKLLIILVLIFIFSACKKQVEKDRNEFVGRWFAKIAGDYFVDLKIDSNSNAIYMIAWQGNATYYHGSARASDRHFKIGRLKYFKIVEYPHKIDTTIEKIHVYDINDKWKLATWKMKLDGMKPECLHVCGTWTYYKTDY
mgnify:CR=1 FL=1